MCGCPRGRPRGEGTLEKEASTVTCGAFTDQPVGREGAVRSHELVPCCKKKILKVRKGERCR